MSYRPVSPALYCLSLLLCSLFVPPLSAAPQLGPFEADYEINRSGLTLIQMHRLLKANGNGEYRFESDSRTTGALSWFIKDRIHESTLWRRQDDTLRPLVYRYEQYGGSHEKHIELVFDWTANTVTDKGQKPTWRENIPPQTTDKLLYQLQLMLDLQAGRDTLAYTIADSGKLRHYRYQRVGQETLRLALGSYETVKLHRNSGRRSTTIWCAPALNYLPIRIEHTEKDGSRMQANVTRVKGLPLDPGGETAE
jgi:hypothetical protein